MLLVLHHPGDPVVAALAAEWIDRGATPPIVLLSSADFVSGVGWHYHHPDHERDRLRLPGGAEVHAHELTAVFNRLRWLEPPPFPDERDQQYASAEIFAFAVAWLRSLDCAVVNPATPLAPADTGRSLNEILLLAESSGLAARATRLVASTRPRIDDWEVYAAPRARFEPLGLRLDPAVPIGTRPAVMLEPLRSTTAVQVVGDTVIGSPDPDLDAGLVRFARRLELTLAGVTVGWSARRDRWVVCDATGFPTALLPETTPPLLELLTGRASATTSPT